jgi:hypothetical protein
LDAVAAISRIILIDYYGGDVGKNFPTSLRAAETISGKLREETLRRVVVGERGGRSENEAYRYRLGTSTHSYSRMFGQTALAPGREQS